MEQFQNVRRNKRKRHLSDSHSKLPCNVQTVIQNLFEKKFSYTSTPECDYDLENHEEVRLHEEWSLKENLQMKNELNSLKNNLNDKDMLTWHDHTREVNLAGQISSDIRSRVRPELCTQAWCKFYEIASRFINLDNMDSLFSVHLCEAPGAFITSLNHYLYTHDYRGNWQWLATTLNPYYEGNSISHMIDEDRFIRCSHDNWYFGEDGTGNLMSESNLEGLKKQLGQYDVNLVTADGSIDCQGDPAEQENVVSRLQHCEVLTALHILSPGGTLVVKMFTLFECKAMSLMYLLNCVFEKVEVFKPCTSKGGNSEVYVIGLEYKGRQSCTDLLKIVTPIYFGSKEPEGCLYPLSDLPQSFLQQHSACVEFFKDCQMTAIQRNLDLFKVMSDEERSRLEIEKDYCSECFFNRYTMKSLTSNARLMNTQKGRKPNNGRKNEFSVKAKLEGKFTGSFQERIELSTLPWQQKIETFETYEDIANCEDNSLWIQCPNGVMTDVEISNLRTNVGKPVNAIHSSRFCDGIYLVKTQDIIQNVKWLSTPWSVEEEYIDTIATKLKDTLEATIHYYQSMNSTTNLGNTSADDQNSMCQGNCIGGAQSSNNLENGTSNGKSVRSSPKSTSSLYENGSSDTAASKTNVDSDRLVTCSCAGERVLQDVRPPKQCDGQSVQSSKGCNMCANNKSDPEQIACNDNVQKGENGYKANGTNDLCESQDMDFQVSKENSYKSENTCKLVDSCKSKNSCESENTCKDCWSKGLGKKFEIKSRSDVLNRLCLKDIIGKDVNVGLYCVASQTVDNRFELDQQRELLKRVIQILKTCTSGDYVVLEMGTCLSRFTAGLVYILYRCFQEIGFIHHNGNLLNRHLVCVRYSHCPIRLLEYLEQVDHMMDTSQSECVLEIVPILTLLADSEFSEFLRISNVNLLQLFITTVVNKEKTLLLGNNKMEDT